MKRFCLFTVLLICGCAHVRTDPDVVSEAAVFHEGLSSKSASVRYACWRTMIADYEVRFRGTVLLEFLSADPRRKDFAAEILFRADRVNLADSLAEHLVSKLEEPGYHFLGHDTGGTYHRHGGGWTVEAGGKREYVGIRCPYSAILELGDVAIPYLERMAHSKDLGARVNAEKLLESIKARKNLSNATEAEDELVP